MIKKIIYIIPIIIISFFLLSNQFSCNKYENFKTYLFGNAKQSPLREESESTKAWNIQETFRKIFDLYKDKVVFITTEQLVRIQPHPFFDDPILKGFFGRRPKSRVQKRTGLGTGFIITEDGYICTNHHVIHGVDKIKVTIEDKNYEAKIIGSDARTDIALIKINSREKLEPVYFGDSDRIRVGDWAIAIGNPFGLDKTFTVGVISAIGRKDVDFMGGSHIQTDASINPGNSGGPLINIYGEVVGINRMIYSKSGGYMGIGFAIPINTARSIFTQLQKHKKVKRGYLGVSIVQLTDDYAKELGLESNHGTFIGEVIPGSPADKGGIRVGDIIVKINGNTVKDFKDLLNIIGQTPIGTRLKVTVWRNRRFVNLYINVIERP